MKASKFSGGRSVVTYLSAYVTLHPEHIKLKYAHYLVNYSEIIMYERS